MRNKYESQLGSERSQVQSLTTEIEFLNESLQQVRGRYFELQQEKAAKDNSSVLEHQLETLNIQLKKSDTEIISLNNKINELEQTGNDLERKLSTQSDYNEMKLKLKVLMKAEFELTEDADLQTIIPDKMRQLENKIVGLRKEISELTSEKASLVKQLSETMVNLKAVESTVQQFEKFVSSSSDSSLNQSTIMEGNSDDIIAIVSNQRDRYRRKVQDLEVIVQRLLEDIRAEKAETSKLSAELMQVKQRLAQAENIVFQANSRSWKDIEIGTAQEYMEQFCDSSFMVACRKLGRLDQALTKCARVLFKNRLWRKISLIYFIALHVTISIFLLK